MLRGDSPFSLSSQFQCKLTPSTQALRTILLEEEKEEREEENLKKKRREIANWISRSHSSQSASFLIKRNKIALQGQPGRFLVMSISASLFLREAIRIVLLYSTSLSIDEESLRSLEAASPNLPKFQPRREGLPTRGK